MSAQGQRRAGGRKVASVLCLLAYLCGAAEFLPEFLGFLCSLDPSHTVYVVREQSDLRIVLSHERGRELGAGYVAEQDPCSSRHRHGLVADLVCHLSNSTREEADHEALFLTGTLLEPNEGDSNLAKPRYVPGVTDLFPAATPMTLCDWFHGTDSASVFLPAAGTLHSLRSVVLLI